MIIFLPHLDLSNAPLWMRCAYLALIIVHAMVMTRCGVVLLKSSRKEDCQDRR